MINPVITLIYGIVFLLLSLLLFWPRGGLIGYFQKTRQLSDRILLEDALKHLQKAERHQLPATNESLAGALQISTSRVAKILEDLQHQDLIWIDGETFRLTPSGRSYALQVLRAHRLWERYLSDETGFDEKDWHDLADRTEHELSSSRVNQLSAQLGNPTHDPHGDPIPTAEGDLILHGGKPLTSMPIDTHLRIVHMEDEPETVFAQLVAENLHTGMQLSLIESSPQRVRFWANGDEHVLAPIVASSISVAPIPQEKTRPTTIGEPLSGLHPGEWGEVITIAAPIRGQERRRMMDLGILPGTVIQAEMNSPGGDPTAYRIRGALIALRDDQSRFIRIHRVPEESI